MLKWVWISIVIIMLDQLRKWIAVANLEERVPEAIIPHLNFTLAYNTGAAFSLLSDAGGWLRWFIVAFAMIFSAYLVYWLTKLDNKNRWTAISLAFMLCGALGNGIDRLLNGQVIDFIDVYVNFDLFFLTNGHFAIFNIADVALNIGVVLLIGISLFSTENPETVKTV